MVLFPGCNCCCPCGAETMSFGAGTDVVVTIAFSNAQTYDVCMSEPVTMTLNSAEMCEYYADYTVTGIGSTETCTVRISYLVNGPGCSYVVNGWSTSCSVGVNSVTISETACT